MYNNPLNIRVWAQMFFEDGSVTQGKYIDESVFNKPDEIQKIALEFLNDMNRKKGTLLIWGGKKMYGKTYTLNPIGKYNYLRWFISSWRGAVMIHDEVLEIQKI